MKAENIEMLIQDIEECAVRLYENNIKAVQQTIGSVVQNINNTYLFYINNAKEYTDRGIEIPVQILLSQMQNLLEAVDNQDIIMMADCLWYEIREGLLFFKDVECEIANQ